MSKNKCTCTSWGTHTCSWYMRVHVATPQRVVTTFRHTRALTIHTNQQKSGALLGAEIKPPHRYQLPRRREKKGGWLTDWAVWDEPAKRKEEHGQGGEPVRKKERGKRERGRGRERERRVASISTKRWRSDHHECSKRCLRVGSEIRHQRVPSVRTDLLTPSRWTGVTPRNSWKSELPLDIRHIKNTPLHLKWRKVNFF